MDKGKYKILVSAPLDFTGSLKQKISSEMELVYAYDGDKNRIEALLGKNSFDAWMVHPCPAYRIDKTLVDLCQSLKIIATPSTGSNHIDVAYASSRSIKVFSLRESPVIESIYASSEFTFNLLISTVRRTPQSCKAVLDGKWRESERLFRGNELYGMSLGIVGFGRIGGNLANYSLAFGMKVFSFDPYKTIKNPKVVQFQSLNDMLPEIDALAVCVHLTAETYRMINDSVLAQLKDGVYFINTSRGDVVDEPALIKYLESGKIKGAGLDVISSEFNDNKDGHPLIQYARTHDNLIITPHIAGLTYESETKAQTATYEAVKRFLEGKENP